MGTEAAIDLAIEVGTQVAVSVVVKEVAEELGLDEGAATLVGLSVGALAGRATGSYLADQRAGAPVASSPAPSASPGLDLSAGYGGGSAPGFSPNSTAPQHIAPSANMPVAGASYTPEMQQAGVPVGMLDKSTQATQPTKAPAAQGNDTASRMINNGTSGDAPNQGSDSWWDRIWKSDKTIDTLVGAAGGLAQGYAEGKAVEDQYKAQYDREDEISNRWKNHKYTGKTLAYPNKAQSSMQTRGA